MRFQRARKKEQIESRRQEILCAAEQLFHEGGLDNVTFSHIAKQVSFTRQTIYTYYQTREEVLLDLLGQRLEHFYQSLEAMFPGDELLRRRPFCQRLAHHFIEHRETLRLFSLRHTVLEENVRYESLETFDTLTFTLIPYFASIYPILEPHPNPLKAICEAIGHLDNPPTSEEVLVASLELMTSALTFAADTDEKK